MNQNLMSTFQNIGCQMCEFSYQNNKIGPFDKNILSHDLQASFLVADHSDGHWNGGIAIQYAAEDKEKKDFRLQAEINAYFIYEAEDTVEEKARFIKLLKMNGAFSVLAIFRAQIAAATSVVGMQPGLIIPNINLNELAWTESKN